MERSLWTMKTSRENEACAKTVVYGNHYKFLTGMQVFAVLYICSSNFVNLENVSQAIKVQLL